jgi:hypothetical protein
VVPVVVGELVVMNKTTGKENRIRPLLNIFQENEGKSKKMGGMRFKEGPDLPKSRDHVGLDGVR